jgi:hypothetical protein
MKVSAKLRFKPNFKVLVQRKLGGLFLLAPIPQVLSPFRDELLSGLTPANTAT